MSKFSELFSSYPNSRRPVEFCFSSGMLSVLHVTLWTEPHDQTVNSSGERIVGLQASNSTGWTGAAVERYGRASIRAEKREHIMVLNLNI